MERLIRFGSVGAAMTIALAAMVLSYSGLMDLALDAEISPRLALLVPIMVDGLQFVGSLGVVYSTLSGLRSWYPWVLMLMGVSVSAWGNWQAAPDDLTAKLLHASAPIILALVLEELLRVMRHKVHLHSLAMGELAAEQERVALTESESEAVSPADVAAPAPMAPSPVTTPLPVPEVAVVRPSAPIVSENVQVSAPVVKPEDQVEVEGRDLNRLVDGETIPVVESPVETPTTPATAPVVEAPVAEVPVETPGRTWTPREAVVPLSALRAQATSDEATAPTAKESTPSPVPPVEERAKARESLSSERPTEATVSAEDDDALPPYPENAAFKDQVRAILNADADITAAHIARTMGRDPSHTRKVVREVRADMDAEAAEGTEATATATVQEPTRTNTVEAPTAPTPQHLAAQQPAATVDTTPDAFESPRPVIEVTPQPDAEPTLFMPVPAAVAAPVTSVAEVEDDDADPFASATPVYAAR